MAIGHTSNISGRERGRASLRTTIDRLCPWAAHAAAAASTDESAPVRRLLAALELADSVEWAGLEVQERPVPAAGRRVRPRALGTAAWRTA